MSVTLLALPRDDVAAYLGPAWPVPADAPRLRLPADSGITDGALIVYATPGQPGTTWWVIDGVVPPQDAGPVGEELAALAPGSVLETPPTPDPDPTPPLQ
ncbi:hypothetical protein ABZS95_10200 [Streptomyces sp. NPDC005479]|uniref:hypothetical protein n=1 Tax=Streptomyces sp. NPDC005479 TaxID=3154879 RepID=UPI0033BE789E